MKEGEVDILAVVKTEEDIKECVRNILNDIIVEKGEKLVIFIDELDRCMPSFAIEMLERIKHYFDDERIYYGNEFDSTRYLNRFFDISINLPELDSFYKQKAQCFNSSNYWLTKIADELSDYYSFSLRDKLIYKSRIESVDKNYLIPPYSEGLLMALFVAIIIILDMINAKEKKKFLEGKSNFIDRVMPEIECYSKYLLKFFGEGSKEEQAQRLEDGHKKILNTYRYTFEKDTEDDFDEIEISRDFKAQCIKAYNGVQA